MTPYSEVNALLDILTASVRDALGERFVGLYLYGSLATGDFDPATSDVDFLAVTEAWLPDDAIERLRAMHETLRDTGGGWAGKLEGSYLPRSELARYRPDMPPVPHVNERRFFMAGHGGDWVLQRHVLREHPVVVAGPPIASWIEPVGPPDIRAAVRAVMRSWWEPHLSGASRLSDADYQVFAVLTMCRALHAVTHGNVVSKRLAAGWAAKELGEPWAGLIDAAAAWRPELPFDRLDDVTAFIGFTLRRL